MFALLSARPDQLLNHHHEKANRGKYVPDCIGEKICCSDTTKRQPASMTQAGVLSFYDELFVSGESASQKHRPQEQHDKTGHFKIIMPFFACLRQLFHWRRYAKRNILDINVNEIFLFGSVLILDLDCKMIFSDISGVRLINPAAVRIYIYRAIFRFLSD